jgi:hypothetical protein
VIARAVALASLIGGGAAEAHCHRPSHVLGYSRCEETAWWTQPITASMELSTSVLHLDASSIDATAPTADHQIHWAVPAGARSLDAIGGGLAVRAGSDHWYVRIGAEVFSIVRGPPLVTSETDGGVASANAGSIAQLTVGAGLHQNFGRFAAGFELDGGGRAASFTRAGGAELQAPWQAAGIIEARATADIWFGPSLSIGARIATDVLDLGSVTATLAFTLHALPFDGLN